MKPDNTSPLYYSLIFFVVPSRAILKTEKLNWHNAQCPWNNVPPYIHVYVYDTFFIDIPNSSRARQYEPTTVQSKWNKYKNRFDFFPFRLSNVYVIRM